MGKRKVCEWQADDEPDMSGAYATQCGELFQITDGTPADNGMQFCCYCGAHLLATYPPDELDDEP